MQRSSSSARSHQTCNVRIRSSRESFRLNGRRSRNEASNAMGSDKVQPDKSAGLMQSTITEQKTGRQIGKMIARASLWERVKSHVSQCAFGDDSAMVKRAAPPSVCIS
ncbi:hypothetical protein KCU62_g309, partial [Aureobasidium sp. EXF-3399]